MHYLFTIMAFYLLQQNVQSLYAHGQEFKKYAFNLPGVPDILCLQETTEYGAVLTQILMRELPNIDTNGFVILNTGTGSPINIHTGNISRLDITFCSSNITAGCTWSVDQLSLLEFSEIDVVSDNVDDFNDVIVCSYI